MLSVSEPVNAGTSNSEKSSERLASACLALMMLMASLGSSVANAALPTLSRELGASFQSAQWIVLSYLLAVTTLVVSIGRLADTVGHRRLAIVGISLFTSASVLCAMADTLAGLIAARAVQGLAAAAVMATPLALVHRVVAAKRLGTAMGLLGAMSAIGTAAGPSLGGLLTGWLGWRFIFLITTPVGLAGLILAFRYLPTDTRKAATERRQFDLWGTLLLALGLGAYSLSMTLGRGAFGPLSVLLAIGAVAALAVFGVVQARSRFPLVPLDLFRDRIVSGGLMMSLLVSTVLMSTLVVGPFYLAGTLRLDASAVGLALTVGPLVVAASGVPAGRLADRFGAPTLAIGGLLGIAAGCMLLSVLPAAAGILGFVLPMVMIAAGYAGFQTANNTAVMGGVEVDRRGLLSGVLNLSRNLGLVTGASVMGYVFAAASGASVIGSAGPEQVSHGFRATFAMGALLIGIALVVALLSSRPQRESVALIQSN